MHRLLTVTIFAAAALASSASKFTQVATAVHVDSVTTTDATQTTLIEIEPIADSITNVRARVCCRRPSDNAGKVWVVEFAVRRTGSDVPELIGLPVTVSLLGDLALAACTVTIDTANAHYRVRVTGLPATTLDWGIEDYTLILSP